MDRTTKFIGLFNKLSDHLHRTMRKGRRTSFPELVRHAAKRNPAVRRYAAALKDYGELRNVIVHHRAYPGKTIAEPTEETLSLFGEAVRNIISPPRLVPRFRRNVRPFTRDGKLLDALEHMRDRDYSQIVVRDGGGISLLTVEGVARWLWRKAGEDAIGVRDATIGDALACEPPGSLLVMGRNRTIYDAEEAFGKWVEGERGRLYAIVVTPHGKRTEKPIGIVTPWDLLSA